MITLRTKPSTQPSSMDLVLIHAFPFTSAMYDNACKELQKLMPSLSLHLVDLPGAGDAPYREQWTLAEAMQSLHQKLTEREIVSPVLCGTSMGGYAVLSYYRLYPEEASALILSNTKAGSDTEEAKQNREAFAQDVEQRGHDAVYARMLDKLIARESQVEHATQIRSYIASIEPRAIAATLRALARREDSADLLDQIELPTLIITGENDDLIPISESRKLSVIRNSHVVAIAGTAHLPAVERPAAWAEEVVQFLSTLSGSPL